MTPLALPISYTAPMVRAIDENRKGQTRRVQFDDKGKLTTWGKLAERWAAGERDVLLWVREAWRVPFQFDDFTPGNVPSNTVVQYEATGPTFDDGLSGKVRSYRYMPRWASRFTLRVTDVRVQRLWKISEADAITEGIAPVARDCRRIGGGVRGWGIPERGGLGRPTAREAFAELWETIQGPGAWDKNPHVVAISFEVLKQNVKKVMAERGGAS